MGWSAAGHMNPSQLAVGSDLEKNKSSGIIKSILIKEKSIDSLRYYILQYYRVEYNKDLRDVHT